MRAACADVSLPGLCAYFRRSADDERGHAQALMDLQAARGGRVQLQAILAPDSDFGGGAEEGDALHAMNVSLAFEKLNFRKLNSLHKVAADAGDSEVTDFVESMLQDQVDDIKRTADYVTQLQRVGQARRRRRRVLLCAPPQPPLLTRAAAAPAGARHVGVGRGGAGGKAQKEVGVQVQVSMRPCQLPHKVANCRTM